MINSNNQSKILILKIMNHFMMLDYSIINKNEITYFIHYSNLVKSEDKSAI